MGSEILLLFSRGLILFTFGLGNNFPALPTEEPMKLTACISVSVLFWKLIRGRWFSRPHNSPGKWRGSSRREQQEAHAGYVAGGSGLSSSGPAVGAGAGRSLARGLRAAGARLSSSRQATVMAGPGPVFPTLPLPSPAGSPQGRVVPEEAFCLAVPSRSLEKRSSLASSAMGSDSATAVRNLNWTIDSPPLGCCLNKAFWLPNIIHLPEEPGLLPQPPLSSGREHEGWTEADPGAGLTTCDVSLQGRKGSGWSSCVMATKQISGSWSQTSELTSFRKGLTSWMRLFRLKAIRC